MTTVGRTRARRAYYKDSFNSIRFISYYYLRFFFFVLFQNGSTAVYSFVDPTTIPTTTEQRIPTWRLR